MVYIDSSENEPVESLMARYTNFKRIDIAQINSPIPRKDIDEYSWNIAPGHSILVLKSVEAGNTAIKEAERQEARWGYRYLRGIGLDIEYTRTPDEAFADVNPSTIQISYSHVTLIFQMRFFESKRYLIVSGIGTNWFYRDTTGESAFSIGERIYYEGGRWNRT
jgi:hypothetical protein